MTSMQSKRRPERGAQPSEDQEPETVVDCLAGLLPEEALQDALKGLEPDQITGPGGLLTQLAGRVIETALGAELTEHLGHPPGGRPQGPNVRNGAGRKTVQTDLGAVQIQTPRDRKCAKIGSWQVMRRPGLRRQHTRASAPRELPPSTTPSSVAWRSLRRSQSGSSPSSTGLPPEVLTDDTTEVGAHQGGPRARHGGFTPQAAISLRSSSLSSSLSQ